MYMSLHAGAIGKSDSAIALPPTTKVMQTYSQLVISSVNNIKQLTKDVLTEARLSKTITEQAQRGLRNAQSRLVYDILQNIRIEQTNINPICTLTGHSLHIETLQALLRLRSGNIGIVGRQLILNPKLTDAEISTIRQTLRINPRIPAIDKEIIETALKTLQFKTSAGYTAQRIYSRETITKIQALLDILNKILKTNIQLEELTHAA